MEKPKNTELTVQRKKPIIQEKINQELTVQRKKPIIQEKMNQVTKPIEFPQAQFLNKVDDMLVDVQRQISPMVQTVQKTIETQQLQCIDKVIDVPVVLVAQVPQLLSDVQAPTMQVVEKTVEDPQLQIVVETAKTPETQMIQGTQTSESLGNAPVSENPLVRFTDRVVDVPVVAQRQVPSAPRVQKIVETPKVQISDGHVDMPVVAQRQVPMIPDVQKVVEVPQIQYIDKIVDAPVVARSEDVSVGTQTVSRKRKLSMETESADGTSDAEHGLVQEEESRREMDETRERHAAGEDPDLLQVAPNMEAGGSHLQGGANRGLDPRSARDPPNG